MFLSILTRVMRMFLAMIAMIYVTDLFYFV